MKAFSFIRLLFGCIMYPYIEIFGRSIPTYGLCAGAGFIAAIIYIKIAERAKREMEADIELAAIYSVIGMFIGAKLLYIITALPDLVQDIKAAELTFSEFSLKYLQSGFLFYGGLVGGVLTVWIYAKICKISFDELCFVLVPVIPLFHMFGRIGCFLAGCCYGVESELFGIAFSNSLAAPNDVKLLPVQLMEAAAELLLFLILLLMKKKGSRGKTLLYTWTIAYAALRFVIEFFRGDEYRGFIGALSTAQVFSIIMIILVLVFLFIGRFRTGRKNAGTT